MNSLRFSISLALAALMTAGLAVSEPYLPAGDEVVLERVAMRGPDTAGAQVALRAGATPFERAQSDIELARRSGDQRYLGVAESILAPLLAVAQPAPQALVLQATILQSRHDFAASEKMLAQALDRDPANLQGWLTLSAVQDARGEYESARKSCGHLLGRADSIITAACLALPASLSGQLQASRDLLQRTYTGAGSLSVSERQWVLGLLADMAERLGKPEAALESYRAASAAGPLNLFMTLAEADLLIDQSRFDDALALLAGSEESEAVLLRKAIAYRGLQKPDLLASARQVMLDRFEERRRGHDEIHIREEAQFELRVMNRPEEALALARRNWEVQREPADLRILLEAALAAGDAASARLGAEWAAACHLEDRRLDSLIQEISKKWGRS